MWVENQRNSWHGIDYPYHGKLFATLEESGGMQIPLSPDSGERNDLRDPKGPKGAPFPDSFLRPPAGKLAALAQKLRPG